MKFWFGDFEKSNLSMAKLNVPKLLLFREKQNSRVLKQKRENVIANERKKNNNL